MNAVLTEKLVAVAQAARMAGHGGKGGIYETACCDLGLSRATLLRKLKEVSVMAQRKRRSDAGHSALTRDEAMMISAVLMESTRKNGKRLYSVADAVETLRANAMIQAEYLDTSTGELRPLQRCEMVELAPLDGGRLEEYLKFKFDRLGKPMGEVIDAGGIDALRARLTLTSTRRDHPETVSLLYPLAVGNLLTACMNLAAEIGVPTVTADVVKGV